MVLARAVPVLTATLAVVRKDLATAVRTPLVLALGALVPLAFVGIFALVIQTSATNPVAVADHAGGPHSAAFVEVLEEIATEDGPYFRVVTRDPHEASRAYAAGDVPGVIEIPPDFDEQVAAGAAAPVTLRVFNIDSDATKNLELRLAHAVRRFEERHGDGRAVTVAETSALPRDIPMQRYFGTALLVFTVVYLAMVNTGTLVAGEWEERTAKGVVLSPLGFAPLILGKWAAAGALSMIGAAAMLAVLAAGLGYPVGRLDAWSVAALVVLFGYGAAIGALLGVKLRSSLLLVPASAVIAVTHLLLSGFESYIRGFASDGVLLALWRLASWWPVSALTDGIRFTVEGFPDAGRGGWALAAMAVLAAVLTALAVRHLRRHLTFAQAM